MKVDPSTKKLSPSLFWLMIAWDERHTLTMLPDGEPAKTLGEEDAIIGQSGSVGSVTHFPSWRPGVLCVQPRRIIL
jgi:hypothetical protein